MHYALPDYVLLSHSQDDDGEQEDRLLLVVEIKALGRVDPDTQGGRQTAETIFQRTFQQRENQARLAFRSHPSQNTVEIVMASGPWFAPYTFKRSEILPDEASDDEGSPQDYSPPIRKRLRNRKGALCSFYSATAVLALIIIICSILGGQPTAVLRKAEDVGRGGNRRGERSTVSQDGGKRKRGAKSSPKTAAPVAVVNHVFQLGPSGERNALNPWFLQLLGRIKNDLAGFKAEFETQNSWFDLRKNPTGDGHAEGFVLPTTVAGPVPEAEDTDIGHVVRLDEDPALASEPSTPGNGSETLNMMQLNAMLSPAIRRTTRAPHGGSDTPSIDSRPRFGTLPPGAQEAQSTESGSGTDDDTTPKGLRDRQIQGSSSQRSTRELSPSEAYLGRRLDGSLRPAQRHPMPLDSSPPHFTPHKRLFSRHTPGDESDSDPFTVHDSPGPAAIPRPASSPPYAPYVPMDEDPPSRSAQSRPSDRVQQVHTDPSIPSTSLAPPSQPLPLSRAVKPSPNVEWVDPLPLRRALSRAMVGRIGDPTPCNDPRLTATQQEWRRRLPCRDELIMIAMKTPLVAGVRDVERAFRDAGMPPDINRRAFAWFQDYLEKMRIANGIEPAASATDSGATTGPPPPTSGGDGARMSRPPHASGSGARATDSTAGRRDTSDSSESSSHSNDFSDDSASPADLGPAHEAQMNRLTEGIGNLDVANVPRRGGAPRPSSQRGNPKQVHTHRPDRLDRGARLRILRRLGMNKKQAEDVHDRYVQFSSKDELSRRDALERFVKFDDAVTGRTATTSVAPVREQSQRAGSSALPGPSNINRAQDSEEDPSQQADADFVLPESNPEPGQSGTNASRKGKERQR
ncbi:hypothetical protein GSI_14737 [Ganoderma sinense ZZ0214-1]|uniref:Uncharacterized protein n=1 Tax=Ganoderma sinense ZZ0214-1 TaxID=1077348 RepID=A0A2G8RPJ9_9APHY|nr:hypothetical protein GSI_14737 [Ganoderma sinense ZZ0214-1]